VLTTYQHHFIDLPTGFALGWLCVWLWPMPHGSIDPPAAAWRLTADPARHRLAIRYAAAAALCLASALLVGGWALWLAWPALALGLVAAAYAGLGASVFQKDSEGRLSLAARWLLAPYLAGAWLNSRWWTRREPRPVPVADGVWIGRFPSARELARSQFTGVVDLSAELSLPRGPQERAVVPVLDLTTPDTDSLDRAARAIESLRAKGNVLVCCALGYSRSACAVAAWLVASGRAPSAEAAIEVLRAARNNVVLDDSHARALRSITTT
jgi:protein-tyrosine phosphatase